MSLPTWIHRAAVAAAALTWLAACSATQPPSPAAGDGARGVGEQVGADCNAPRASSLIGAPYSAESAARAAQAAGARTVRVLRPGEVHTMEFVATRLTIELDSAGAIRSVRCG